MLNNKGILALTTSVLISPISPSVKMGIVYLHVDFQPSPSPNVKVSLEVDVGYKRQKNENSSGHL